MNPKQYREILAGLRLSQARLGRLLGVDKNTPVRWGKGATPIPGAVTLLLKLLASDKVTIDEMEAL